MCLPARSWDKLRSFVAKGGKLIVEGLSGYYDEDMRCRFQTGFPLQDVWGGCLQESKCTPGDFPMTLDGQTLPVHLWAGFIHPGGVTTLRNRYGKGEVYWVPSCIGLGARRATDYGPLSRLLLPEMAALPAIRLTRGHAGVLVQRFRADGKEGALLINKSGRAQEVSFTRPGARVLYSSKKNSGPALEPEECRILLW